MPGDPQVGLGQRHSTLDRKLRKKCQCWCISSRTPSSPASRAASRPEPTPNQPGTICRDWVQPKTQGMARSPSRPAPESGRRDGAGAEVQFGELVDGGGGEEVRGQVGVVDQRAVGAVGGVGDGVHRRVPAGQRLVRLARRGVQGGCLQRGGDGQLQVLAGERGEQVLVGDDLALLGDLDLAFEGAPRLGEDRVVGGAAAAADGAAAAVEEAQPYAVRGGRRRAAARWARWISHCEVVMPPNLEESE